MASQSLFPDSHPIFFVSLLYGNGTQNVQHRNSSSFAEAYLQIAFACLQSPKLVQTHRCNEFFSIYHRQSLLGRGLESRHIWDFNLGRLREHEESSPLEVAYGANDAGFNNTNNPVASQRAVTSKSNNLPIGKPTSGVALGKNNGSSASKDMHFMEESFLVRSDSLRTAATSKANILMLAVNGGNARQHYKEKKKTQRTYYTLYELGRDEQRVALVAAVNNGKDVINLNKVGLVSPKGSKGVLEELEEDIHKNIFTVII
ncbi:hypothetical protein FNV43_RR10949 [Rhamnella rubrinervis]|uniref:Uncharacterized protein n=1 Tax=Rhamnella rubrinervis TaxID=2594499 RepID=A0A8K0H4Q0_9ROSA|nr:hypothetical protein FNV43_RR10949 [Rhamnella rubrinervis]